MKVKFFRDFSPQSSSIDLIRYGNPPAEFLPFIQNSEDPIRKRFDAEGWTHEIIRQAPTNLGETTREDLEKLQDLTQSVGYEAINFARYVDNVENLANLFIDLAQEYGVQEDMGNFFAVDAQSDSLLHYLKYMIDRPRPYQLARVLDFEVYPLIRTDAMTAAYPSGHALTAFIMGEYYSRLIPDGRLRFEELAVKIAQSREIVGIHYPSDTAISKIISGLIWEHDLIQDPKGSLHK